MCAGVVAVHFTNEIPLSPFPLQDSEFLVVSYVKQHKFMSYAFHMLSLALILGSSIQQRAQRELFILPSPVSFWQNHFEFRISKERKFEWQKISQPARGPGTAFMSGSCMLIMKSRMGRKTSPSLIYPIDL
jgi:hypothetical protein